MSEYKEAPVLTKILEAPRYACSLGGAIQSVMGMHRAIPIVHSTPGCGYNLYLGYRILAGVHGTAYVGGSAMPCSRMCQKEVVFGGEEKLREIIHSSLDILDGDCFIVLTGCAAGLVGDDVPSVVKEFQDGPVPLFYVETPGYKGNTYRGYELLLEALTDQAMTKAAGTERGLVNILGIIPNQDVFWRGNLREIQRILERLGLKANMLFGHDEFGVDAWKKVPQAELTIVLSPWVGIAPAKKIMEKFGVPYMVFPELPIGCDETSSFLRQVGQRLGVPDEVVNRVIAEEEKEVYYYLTELADCYIDFGFRFDFVVIGDSNYVIGVTKFMTNQVGNIPLTAVITDDPPDQYRACIAEELTRLDYGLKPQVIFESNSGKIWEALKESEASLILGSTLDAPLAKSLGAAHLSIGFPIAERAITNNTYAGYKGCLQLVSDIYTAVMQTK
ncbi:MAG: hydrogenase [Chloroflexi bacterium]|nr:hydrogenase [Chloroflexota bacterium]